MITGAIFDVDGTLLDSMEIWEEAGVRYLKSLLIDPEENLSQILFPMTIEEGAFYMKQRYRLKESMEEIQNGILHTVRDFYYNEAPLKPGVKDFLEALFEKGVKAVAATSSEREHIEAAFQRLGIAHYFQKILTCSEVGEGKKKPTIYLEAEKYLKTARKDTFVFEDVLYAINTAKNAGFRTVGMYDRFSHNDWAKIKEEAEISLKDFTEVQKFWKYAAQER